MVRVKEPEEDEVEIVEQPKDQDEKELEVTQKIIPMPDLHLLSHKDWSRKLKKESLRAPKTTAIQQLMADRTVKKPIEYVFLSKNNNMPIIIATDLNDMQVEALMSFLKQFKRVIGWTIANIIGIPLGICSHKIQLMPDSKPSIERQRRLNQLMQEVVKKEIIKLLDAGVVYPIADSNWICLIQCMLNKGGIIVVPNSKNELIPMRPITGRRVCLDYRKLNAWTENDHVPMLFMDQILDRLAGIGWYYFLDGYSGYNLISIAPEDQKKTNFTYPYGTFAFKKMSFGLCNAPATY
ncbi:uncharacterized protein LOC125837657 [Solanum verrucosum]|uniref:uncharacterized protein LOC125837657 n=1 Tax=Solanum verrucosum TaxID=315347 RepID=UPI0020D0FA7D|nr:uncharacterized protein LOC125837657 [Solanum verrucosum]